MIVIDPHFGFAAYDSQHFFDRMMVCRRTCLGRYPLLKYAKLSRTIDGGYKHACSYPISPVFKLLL
ncbi:hypothetical protein [Mesorhizobium sp. KR9-304]|uniref:hypothetical protein n=1 Tax=Mesorhizobium sp. KR9-304 TaxID=3156614 RepID=UPI0032B554A5